MVPIFLAAGAAAAFRLLLVSRFAVARLASIYPISFLSRGLLNVFLLLFYYSYRCYLSSTQPAINVINMHVDRENHMSGSASLESERSVTESQERSHSSIRCSNQNGVSQKVRTGVTVAVGAARATHRLVWWLGAMRGGLPTPDMSWVIRGSKKKRKTYATCKCVFRILRRYTRRKKHKPSKLARGPQGARVLVVAAH